MSRHDLTLADVDRLNAVADTLDKHLNVPNSAAGLRDLATRIRHQLDVERIDASSQLNQALELARVALLNSSPVMKHYPEPVKRHADALAAVEQAQRVLDKH